MPLIHQNNFSIAADFKPRRIISLVPSQTELLYDLGLDDTVIGITKFCTHPAVWFKSKARIGGTKTLDIEKIKTLQPDLILANKEENKKEQVEALAYLYPVYVSDIANLTEATQMIQQVGVLAGKATPAFSMAVHITELFAALPKVAYRPATAYLIWRSPYMAAGGHTFISNLMELCGFENIFASETRYPQVTIKNLQEKNCELLILSSEPYPFKQKNIDELQAQLPNTTIILADGEMFSWYGSRLLLAAAYFTHLQASVKAFHFHSLPSK